MRINICIRPKVLTRTVRSGANDALLIVHDFVCQAVGYCDCSIDFVDASIANRFFFICPAMVATLLVTMFTNLYRSRWSLVVAQCARVPISKERKEMCTICALTHGLVQLCAISADRHRCI